MSITTDDESRTCRVAVAQVGGAPGDVELNLERCVAAIDEAAAGGADLVVFPELALTGMQVERFGETAALAPTSPALAPLRERSRDVSIAVGFLEDAGAGRVYNAIGYFEGGELVHVHRKLYLTTYGLLAGEGSVLTAGVRIASFPTRFGRAAILICEDAWHPSVAYLAVMDGAELLLTCAGSPRGNTSAACSSEELWTVVNRSHAVTLKTVTVFANRAGVEGDLAFWGGSHVIAPDGRMLGRLDHDAPGLLLVDVDLTDVGRQRYRFPYVRDERLSLTQRELERIARRRWTRD
jgi:predicted amidohydrolase